MRAQKTNRHHFVWVWLIFSGIVLVGILGIVVVYVFQNTPRQEIFTGSYLSADPYDLSSTQLEAIQQRGYPDAFTILFYDQQDWDGTLSPVRYETWDYYTLSSELVFINGEMVSESPLDIQVDQLVPMPYRPEQFTAYMSIDNIASAIEMQDYLVVPLEDELVRGGEVYYTDELTFGLRDKQLLYVESLPLEVLQ
jgi:hypothetical protein